MANLGYRLARAMLGTETSDKLRFPKYQTFGLLPYVRTRRRFQEFKQRIPFLRGENIRVKNFGALLDVSMLEDQGGFSYRLPDHYAADLSSKW